MVSPSHCYLLTSLKPVFDLSFIGRLKFVIHLEPHRNLSEDCATKANPANRVMRDSSRSVLGQCFIFVNGGMFSCVAKTCQRVVVIV